MKAQSLLAAPSEGGVSPRSRARTWLAMLAVLLAVALAWHLGGRRDAPPPADGTAGAAQVTTVTTLVAASLPVTDLGQSTGTVAAAQRAELSAKVMGRVAQVFVREGKRVTRGQLLAQLEASDLAAGAAQASAGVGAAGAAAAQAQTAAELQKEQSRGRVQQAEEALKTAQARLSATLEGSRTQEKAAADQQVVLAEAEARNAKANADRYQRLYQQGAASAIDADAKRTEYEVAQTRLETARQQASLSHEGGRRQDIDAARSQVAAAQDALRLAKASVAENRMKADQARLARAQLGQAQAASQAAQAQYGYSRLVAPFSGVIVARLADPGDLASPGKVLLVIEDTSQYRLEAQVPEDVISRLRIGQEVPVRIDALDRPLTGRISRIIPEHADPSSHTVIVKAELQPVPGLTSGLFGRLEVAGGTHNTLRLPEAAIHQRGQLSQIYVVDGGRANLRLVTLGDRAQGQVEILSGLQAGERVVAQPTESLQDGQAVREAGR